jgi:hypothetical protein
LGITAFVLQKLKKLENTPHAEIGSKNGVSNYTKAGCGNLVSYKLKLVKLQLFFLRGCILKYRIKWYFLIF